MQPKFTLQNLGSLFTKSFALAMLFVFSTHLSFAQQPSQSARPKPVVKQAEAKPLTKAQLDAQSNNIALISDNDAGKPNRVKNLDAANIATEAVCTTFTGALTAADPTLAGGRFTRDGVPSTCAVPKPACPGTFGAAGNNFDTYTYINAQAVAQCVTVTVTNNDAAISQFVSAHLGSFNPANVCTNYLADAGSSSAGGGGTVTFSFTLPGSATVVFAVTTLTPGILSSGYSIAVDGICTPCAPIAATAPTISSVPSTTCIGSPITLSILSGNLNGAANWVWYAGGCGTGTSIGTGNSITVSPVANTTYFARGEGGCAPAPGACGSQLVTVTPCTCITPDNATICLGSVQRLAINQTLPAISSTFSKVGAIAVPGTGTGAATGAPANPYPDVLAVSGLPVGTRVSSVTINGFTHTFPSDVDIVLRSPSGQSVIIMSDAGGATAVTGQNLTFSDAALAGITGTAVTGTYKPTNTAGPDAFPAPGPGSITQVNPTLSSFSGSSNGNWELFVVDDLGGDIGTISGWSITFAAPATTATWTPAPGTLFTDPAATIPYVAGSAASVVYAKPTAAGANTYVATVNNGPCTGVNNVTVNVLATPVVTVSPNPGGCSPATLIASGASIYNWSPAAGLNTTTGATVIATTAVNASYTVNGFGANGCAFVPVVVPVTGSSTAAVISSLGAPPVPIWIEGFDAAPLPTGWAEQNLSNPIGTGTFSTWFQGTAGGVFTPQSGADFRSVAFLSGSGTSTLSNWLFTPVTTLTNGDQLTFWTRTTDGTFPDRLQIRMSTNGASTNVGATETTVGDFTVLLLDINPGLTATGYPTAWTLQTATVSGLVAPISGRLAFRYFVTNGGPAGANSDNIGIDNVTYQRPPLATCAFNTSSIKIDITGGTSPYTVIYSDGTTNRTVNSYISGTPIQVSPGVTTTYTIVSVTGANGCAGSGNTGSAVITVTPPPSITTQPVNKTACAGFNTTFTVSAGPVLGTTYQWQVSTNGGTTYTNLTNVAPYSGVTTATLTITGATTALNLNRYRVVITGACPPNSVTSTGATLFVNDAPLIVTQPVATTKCIGTAATFTVVASTPNGPATPTYQWQVSINSGLTYTNITGATTATLTIASVTQAMNNNLYQVVVTTAPCAATVTSNAVKLTVNALPVITIASPITQLVPGRATTISATTTPGPLTPASFSWTRDAVAVAGATTSTLAVDIDKIGTYRATVTDVNGCVGTSNNLVIGTEASDRLWLYPNPTDGLFQVRLYFPNFNVSERREVSVWNANGQMVARKSLDFVRGMSPYSQVNFDLTGVAPGTYLVKVTDKSTSRITSGLIVIQ